METPLKEGEQRASEAGRGRRLKGAVAFRLCWECRKTQPPAGGAGLGGRGRRVCVKERLKPDCSRAPRHQSASLKGWTPDEEELETCPSSPLQEN